MSCTNRKGYSRRLVTQAATAAAFMDSRAEKYSTCTSCSDPTNQLLTSRFGMPLLTPIRIIVQLSKCVACNGGNGCFAATAATLFDIYNCGNSEQIGGNAPKMDVEMTIPMDRKSVPTEGPGAAGRNLQ